MARKLSKSFERYLREVATVTCEKAAEEVTTDLKEKGPYWTGQFEESWVLRPGDVSIPGNDADILSKREKLQGWEDGSLPLTRRVSDFNVPEPSFDGKAAKITIGNTSAYRGIATDLLPGRYENGKRNTAPRDWFVSYLQGGAAGQALRRATSEAANDPRIKGFKG